MCVRGVIRSLRISGRLDDTHPLPLQIRGYSGYKTFVLLTFLEERVLLHYCFLVLAHPSRGEILRICLQLRP